MRAPFALIPTAQGSVIIIKGHLRVIWLSKVLFWYDYRGYQVSLKNYGYSLLNALNYFLHPSSWGHVFDVAGVSVCPAGPSTAIFHPPDQKFELMFKLFLSILGPDDDYDLSMDAGIKYGFDEFTICGFLWIDPRPNNITDLMEAACNAIEEVWLEEPAKE